MPCWCHCQFMQIKLVNHWIIGQFLHILCCHNNNGDCLRTAWGLAEDAWGLPEDFLRVVCLLSNGCLRTAWGLHDNCHNQLSKWVCFIQFKTTTTRPTKYDIFRGCPMPIRALQPKNKLYLNLCLLVPCWCHCQFMQIKLVNHWIIGQFLHILCCHNNCDGYWNRSRPSLNLANIF